MCGKAHIIAGNRRVQSIYPGHRVSCSYFLICSPAAKIKIMTPLDHKKCVNRFLAHEKKNITPPPSTVVANKFAKSDWLAKAMHDLKWTILLLASVCLT